MRQSLLERIVDERAGQTLVGTVSVAVDRLAEEIAREGLTDPMFRRSLRELVPRRSQDLSDKLLRNGAARNGHAPAKRRRKGR